ncbi:MAG TPA: OB-fold domain-containing protein [Acidimicrobiales bacterium]
MTPVAVLAVGAAAPTLRMAASEVAGAWGGGGRGAVAVCDADEDSLTLAWQAAVDALTAAGVSAADVSGLWWGTSRPPFAEGPSHAFLSTALGIGPTATGTLCSGSPHAGMEALMAAWDALAAGHAGLALVVASDALVPGVGTAGEFSTGAGAVAFVLGSPGAAAAGNGSGPPARLVGRSSRVMAVVDRYRGDAGAATGDVYDGRLFREEVFLPLMTAVGRDMAAAGTAPAAWAMADPDGKLAPTVAKRLGGPLVSAAVQTALGDTGSAAALLGVIPGCASTATPGVLGSIAYGGGRATAVAVEVTRAVPGADAAIERLGGGLSVSYIRAIRARGQLEPMSDPIQMGLPPAGAAFVRGNVEMLGFEGARCRACGTISTPPSIHPRCNGCGGGDLEVVPLARRGRVQTFVVNQTMPPPFQAPLPMVVVDLDDGARIMVQGASADADVLAIDDEVTLALRLYAMERGIPVYGYKALRVTKSSQRPGPSVETAVGAGARATPDGAAGGGR